MAIRTFHFNDTDDKWSAGSVYDEIQQQSQEALNQAQDALNQEQSTRNQAQDALNATTAQLAALMIAANEGKFIKYVNGAFVAAEVDEAAAEQAQAMIAAAEASSTASRAHAVGDYFRLGGVLYITTAAIAAGDTITVETNCVRAVLGDEVSALKNDVLDLQYKEIAIGSFTATPRQVEKGSTVTEVVLSYTLNKTPATLKLDGVDLIPASSGTETKTGLGLTENHSWTLAATDTGSPSHAAASDSATATLSFLNKAYWGVDTIPDTLNSAFVLGLANSVLTGTKARTITVNATSGKYIWYAVPTSFGTCSFKIGGFDGGFEAPTTISLTNASGHTENYYVYRSTNPSLGNTTVVIS